MTITLNKALNRKNVIVGKINKIQTVIAANNSWNVQRKTEWDIKALMKERMDLVEELIDLKTKIENANVPIRKDIFTLSELKGELNFLDTIETKNGKFIVNSRFGGEPFEETFESVYTEKDIKMNKDAIQKHIDELQDKISEFNFTTKIEIN